jgi:hypothetical protein
MSREPQPEPARVQEWRDVDANRFDRDIIARGQPAVLRGVVTHWPAVAAARESAEAMRSYLGWLDCGAQVRTFVGEPTMKGRFFYNSAMNGFNFGVAEAPFDRLLAVLADESDARHVYMGSTSTEEILPGFERENPLDLVAEKPTAPRIWIGKSSVIAPHFDESDNIACVVSGRRRFTLFPPDQVANLYPGPIDHTVAGQPTSMVELANPDLGRFPRFREALEHAVIADLEPGDGIYIPALWWHGVEATERLNVLVNYWWQDTPADAGSPMNAMGAALLSIALLPERKRLAWRSMFEHFVFRLNGDPTAHFPERAHGILGRSTPELRKMMREFLIRELKGK